MTREQAEVLRRWVRVEIELALARQEEGADGYYRSAVVERLLADKLFEELLGGFPCQ